MLESWCDDVIAVPPQFAGGPFDREVVRFGAASREHDLCGAGADRRRDSVPSVFNDLARGPPVGVDG
jgi:hypothetical protein